MSWEKSRSAVLTEKVENMNLEAHPVSGEIEIADPESIQYRRLDQETLHSRLDVREFELLPIYVWCDEDPTGDGPGWKLHELRTIEDIDDGTEWLTSEAEANEANPMHASDRSKITHLAANHNHNQTSTASKADDEDDDSYWASYDQTPGRTPAQHSPAPRQTSFAPMAAATSSKDADGDDSYYARYGSVQPALDPHDPDEEVPEVSHQSTLNGSTLSAPQPLSAASGWETRSMFPADKAPSAHDSATASTSHEHEHLSQPRPTSPGSVVSDASVERLEQGAADMTRAEAGVKTHVAAEVKSLFRLARSIGVDRAEFERIVRTQLDVIGMLEDEE